MTKKFEESDPMELKGVTLPEGDLEEMAEALVEEFVRMGFDEKKLFRLFTNPNYRTTHRIYREKGEEYVKDLINRIRERWVEFRVKMINSKSQIPS